MRQGNALINFALLTHDHHYVLPAPLPLRFSSVFCTMTRDKLLLLYMIITYAICITLITLVTLITLIRLIVYYAYYAHYAYYDNYVYYGEQAYYGDYAYDAYRHYCYR